MNPAARSIAGVPLLNSVTCEQEALERGLRIARHTGASIVILTMDSKGIPEDAKGRLKLAEKAAGIADSIGLPRRALFFDPLTLALGEAQGRITSGKELALFGVGSGLGCLIMGVTW